MNKLRMISSLILLILSLSITSCLIDVEEYENIVPPEILFCPQDNCTSNLAELIENARISVYCAIYDLEEEEVIEALENNIESDVKLIVDEMNGIEFDGNIRFDTKSQYMHNKFCVIDGMIVWTGSFNPTTRGNERNNNNVVIIQSSVIADNYEDEFEELWFGEFGEGDKTTNPIVNFNGITIKNYFCPDDDCSSKVINEISKAEKSIYFMTFSFTHEGIANAILSKDVEIKGIFEKRQNSRYSQYSKFKGFGAEVILDTNPATMHHKVFIIDNKIVITGSFNPTKRGDLVNDENILIIENKEITKKYLEEFNLLFNSSLT